MSWTPHLSKTKVRNFIQNYICCAESVVPDVRVLPNFELHHSNNSRRSYISWKSHHKVRSDGGIFTHTENFFKNERNFGMNARIDVVDSALQTSQGMWNYEHDMIFQALLLMLEGACIFLNSRTQNVLEVKISRSLSLHRRMMTTWDQAWHFTPTP